MDQNHIIELEQKLTDFKAKAVKELEKALDSKGIPDYNDEESNGICTGLERAIQIINNL